MGLYSHTWLKFESSSGCQGVPKVHNWERAHSVDNCTCLMYFGTGGIRVETKLRVPDSAESCFMVQTSATQMSGERGPKKHCTRLPSQRSACCCSTSLMGDSETLQQTQNTAQQPEPLVFAQRRNNKKKEKEKRGACFIAPCTLKMEPFLLLLQFVFTLRASHSACRTEVLLSICRALLRS